MAPLEKIKHGEEKDPDQIHELPVEPGNLDPACEAHRLKRDPRAYTPKHLADKILQSKSALEGERKQVTVLFADLKGSVNISGAIDPEEWHTIMVVGYRKLARSRLCVDERPPRR